MGVGTLVVLTFVAVAAAIIGIYMLMAGRSQAKQERTLEQRLYEARGATASEPGAQPDDSSLLRTQSSGPLPNIDQIANRALKGSQFELWMEQTGTKLTVSACLLISIMLGGVGALVAMMFIKKGFMAPVGFI